MLTGWNRLTKRQKQYFAFAAAFVSITLLAGLLLLSWSANYNYCVGHDGEHASGQYNQEGLPIFVPALDNPSDFRLFVHCSGVFAEQHAAGITAISTLLLTFITLGLVVLGYFQFTTSRAQLRAYVSIDTGDLYDSTSGVPNWPRARLNIKNSGATPARNVRAWTQIDIAPVNLPTLTPIVFTPVITGSTIASGGMTVHDKVFMHRQLAPNEIAAINAGAQAVYVYGCIKYFDVFNIERENYIRLMHTGSWPPAQGSILYFATDGNFFT